MHFWAVCHTVSSCQFTDLMRGHTIVGPSTDDANEYKEGAGLADRCCSIGSSSSLWYPDIWVRQVHSRDNREYQRYLGWHPPGRKYLSSKAVAWRGADGIACSVNTWWKKTAFDTACQVKEHRVNWKRETLTSPDGRNSRRWNEYSKSIILRSSERSRWTGEEIPRETCHLIS